MLDSFVLRTDPHSESYGELHFMHHGTPHFALSVRASLDSHFPGRWIGRRCPKEWSPQGPKPTLKVTSFCGASQRLDNDQNQEHLTKRKNKLKIICVFHLFTSVCKLMGPMLTSDIKW
jgi:hypothetical protein